MVTNIISDLIQLGLAVYFVITMGQWAAIGEDDEPAPQPAKKEQPKKEETPKEDKGDQPKEDPAPAEQEQPPAEPAAGGGAE